MTPFYRRFPVGLLLVGACLLAACSSGPLSTPVGVSGGNGVTPVVPPVQPGAPLRTPDGRALTVALTPWTDQRPGNPGRKLGDVGATVFGIDGDALWLARDASAVVTDAVRGRLLAQGFAIAGPQDRSDLTLEGNIQALSLNVAGRDERRIVLQAVARAPGGAVVWSGAGEERGDRFAGVAGNNRGDLERYLGEGIGLAATRLATSLRERVGAMPTTASAPAAAARAAAPPVLPLAVPGPSAPSAGGTGFVAITSVPGRVKVYVDDVYHGLTPVTLELPAGVNQLHFKLDGHRSAREKVAVRRGATTELELKLER